MIDPNTITLETYLALVREMDKSTARDTFNKETYKMADTLLTSFSKTHQAWGVTIQALSLPNLTDQEYFHAANVLKNKMMYDFAGLRNKDFAISFNIRDNLLIILKKMIESERPTFVLNCLNTALAILIMHLNENWSDMLENLISELSNNASQATSMLMILKYMAQDCDNDSIVIEGSLRSHFFSYLDSIAPQVFDQIFNSWAQKINIQEAQQRQQIALAAQSGIKYEETTEDFKMQRMKSKLLDALYQWLKLKIPEEVIQGLTERYPDLIQFVFTELETNKDENLENATNCVIEMIILAKREPHKFQSIMDAVVSKVEHLAGRVDQAVAEKDEQLGEQLLDIFVELGQSNLKQIVENGSLIIPQILLKFMLIPELKCRRQVSFWKQLFKQISKMESPELKQAKLMEFEPVLIQLLNSLISQMKAEDDMFEEFNYASEFEEQFDDFNYARSDFGKLIQVICNCCGPQTIYVVFLEKLKGHVAKVQSNPELVSEWSSIECIITCVGDLASTLKLDQVAIINDIIQLVFQLPDKYVALKRAGANLFISLSGIIKEHGVNVKEDVKKFLDYVSEGLENKYAIPACAKAFQKLCVDHAIALQTFTPEIIEKSTSFSLKESLVVPNPATNWGVKQHYLLIVDGIGALVERIEDPQICNACMKRVIQSFAFPLLQKIESVQSLVSKEGYMLQQSDINEGTISSISGYLALISEFLKGCKQIGENRTNPFLDIFRDLWTQFIERNFSLFTHIDEIVEQTIRLVKHCLRILGREFDQYLITFLQQTIKAYQANPIPGFIYGVEFCLVEYHKDSHYDQIFLDALNHLIPRTASLLNSFDAFTSYPDVAYDFFGMCVRFLKLRKDQVFSSQHLEDLIKIWNNGIGVEHKEALLTHTEFIIVLIGVLQKDSEVVEIAVADGKQTKEQVMTEYGIHANELLLWDQFLQSGQAIVDKYLGIILSAPSREVTEKFADVLVEFCLRFPIQQRQLWFTQAFSTIPNDVMTEEEKQRHIHKIIKDRPSYDHLVENFDTIAKRARNTVNRSN